MAVTQLICQAGLELFEFLLDLEVLVMSLFESTLVKFFLFIDEEDLILFAGQKLSQLSDSFTCLTDSYHFVSLAKLFGHCDKVIQAKWLVTTLIGYLSATLVEEFLFGALKWKVETA